METIYTFICANAENAHWILFLCLLLAGLNIPISEDLVLLMAGTLAATCLDFPESYYLYIWVFFGCWFSAWEAYWLGRLWGTKLYTVRGFRHIITPARIEKLQHLYNRFGLLTFIVGRFIPGGVRNTLFITCGMGKMPFDKFIARDFIACLIASFTLFYLGFTFGEHFSLIVSYVRKYELIALALGVLILSGFLLNYAISRKKSKKGEES